MRRTVGRLDKVVVEEGRTHDELGLFESENSVVIPGRLTEGDEGDGIDSNEFLIRGTRLRHMGEHLRTKKRPGSQIHVGLNIRGMTGAPRCRR